MKAMVLERITNLTENRTPLSFQEVPKPRPGKNEVLLKVSACGVCHTELDEIEGRTAPPVFPVILGHQVIGTIEERAENVRDWNIGDRVGVAWIFSSCGVCEYCLQGEENLCTEFKGTGRDVDGGYAEYMVAPESSVYAIPVILPSIEAAPLLCAGAIGYRSLKLANMENGKRLGLSGFGASAHLVLKLVQHLYPRSEVYVFARSKAEQQFALELGASWAGDFETPPPELLHSIIDTTPIWSPVVSSLQHLRRGGRLVINAIRKEDIDKSALATIDYATSLWMEKEIKSVANVTRQDVRTFLEIAGSVPIKPEVQEYRLEDANLALMELKERKIRGAKVLVVG
jgi:propanol-preferring alcohol dehydrogenase